MSSKNIIMFGFVVGSILGSLLAGLLGLSSWSLRGAIISAVSGGVGIWLAYKISQ